MKEEKRVLFVIEKDLESYKYNKLKKGTTIFIKIVERYKNGWGASTGEFREIKDAIKHLKECEKK